MAKLMNPTETIDVLRSLSHQRRHYVNENMTALIYSRVLSPGDVSVDIGANAGFHTCKMASLVGKTGRVHAIEPNLDHARTLLSIGDNVTFWPFAAGDQLEVAQLSIPAGLDGWASLSLNTAAPQIAGREIKRQTCIQVRVDQIPEIHGQNIAFVKIDVETREYQALQGMASTITKSKPMIIIENCTARIEQFIDSLTYKAVDFFGLSLDHHRVALPNQILCPRSFDPTSILPTNDEWMTMIAESTKVCTEAAIT